MSFEIAKAGWLFRLSSILHRWKRSWFVLYQDGTVRYFESPDSHTADEAFRMQPECIEIRVGQQVTGVEPPSGHSEHCLLKIKFRETSWTLCAESPDEMCAWHISLEQSRVIQQRNQQPQQVYAPPGSTVTVTQTQRGRPYPVQPVAYVHPNQGVYGSQHPTYVIQSPDGQQTTVIYTDQGPRYYRNDGTDMAMGFMAGAAMGSLMFTPLLWWW